MLLTFFVIHKKLNYIQYFLSFNCNKIIVIII
ncbi:hypothetical protein [Plasmodium yoelii yoelii]|uniref:Uncharacterized protein n=1 Tax=Plasmodium yoelii yoelii TaxID=73239 RepID=Q7RAI5_PLAYO|nr:hypothetical protein [Plasmodium yoelii yoelii]